MFLNLLHGPRFFENINMTNDNNIAPAQKV